MAGKGICATGYCTIAVGHQTRLLDRIKDRPTREWYLKAAVENRWSQNVLVHHISARLHERQGKALTNFSRALPPEGSDLAEQLLKDPYQFDFLTLASSAKERELERGLLIHLRDLLLELGRGFEFVGSQFPIEVGGQTFYLDLLFYHIRLHCYFVIEFKVGSFKPEYAGKLNFYLSAADDLLRVYGSRGVYLTAVLGGLVNSTASAAELASTLSATGLGSLAVPVVLLTSVAMFLRNIAILAIFGHAAVSTAALPLLGMTAVAGIWIYRDYRKAGSAGAAPALELRSPISLLKVLRLAILFLVVQVVATLGERHFGSLGFEVASLLGGFVSSASSTAAAANLAMHHMVTPEQAGIATVLTSMASASMNLPMVVRQRGTRPAMRELVISSALQIAAGIVALVVELYWRHSF